MVRGKARGTFTRGGGRHYSPFVRDNGGDKMGMVLRGEADDEDSEEGSEDSKEGSKGSKEDSEESESEEESSEEKVAASASASVTQTDPPLSREERRNRKKKKRTDEEQAEDIDPDLINPNHVQQKLNISDLNTPRELTRREREQKEKQDAKERYWKLHVQGKTDEAKSDLKRLAQVRAEREAAQAKRKALADAKAAEAERRAEVEAKRR